MDVGGKKAWFRYQGRPYSALGAFVSKKELTAVILMSKKIVKEVGHGWADRMDSRENFRRNVQ